MIKVILSCLICNGKATHINNFRPRPHEQLMFGCQRHGAFIRYGLCHNHEKINGVDIRQTIYYLVETGKASFAQ